MASLINAYDLDEAIEENLSAYEIAEKFGVSYGSVYLYIDKHGLREKYDSLKEKHHKIIRDKVRTAIMKVVDNLLEKVHSSLFKDRTLKPAEIALLIKIAESDGLIEKDKQPIESNQSELNKLSDEKLLESIDKLQNIINAIKP